MSHIYGKPRAFTILKKDEISFLRAKAKSWQPVAEICCLTKSDRPQSYSSEWTGPHRLLILWPWIFNSYWYLLWTCYCYIFPRKICSPSSGFKQRGRIFVRWLTITQLKYLPPPPPAINYTSWKTKKCLIISWAWWDWGWNLLRFQIG